MLLVKHNSLIVILYDVYINHTTPCCFEISFIYSKEFGNFSCLQLHGVEGTGQSLDRKSVV